MIRVAGLTAALLATSLPDVAVARFEPAEDRRYLFEIDETRSAGGVVRRFHLRRSIVFHRTPVGFEAVVTLEAVDHSPKDDAGAMFQTATSALLGQPLRFRLDPAGHVVGVDEADAAIARIADTIERFGAERRPRSGTANALAAPVRTASREQKTAMLVSILAPVVLPDDAERTEETREVTLPNRPPLRPGARLTGTETVVRGTAVVTITLVATGNVGEAIPGDTPGTRDIRGAAPGLTIRATRRIDAASGLLEDSVETADTILSSDGVPRRAVSETRIRVRLAPLETLR